MTCWTGWTDSGFHWDERNTCYEVVSPDEFFLVVDASAPWLVQQVACDQLAYWYPRTQEVDLPGRLRAAGCPDFAEKVRIHLQSPAAAAALQAAARKN